MKDWMRPLLLVLLLAGVVGCDRTAKHFAERQLEQRVAVGVVPGVLHLRLVKNTDTAFGLLSDYLGASARLTLILTLQGIGTLALAVVFIRQRRDAGRSEHIAGALVLGGAVGNFSERLTRGYVVDFIHVAHWPVFNIADIAICAGVALLLLSSTRTRSGVPS